MLRRSTLLVISCSFVLSCSSNKQEPGADAEVLPDAGAADTTVGQQDRTVVPIPAEPDLARLEEMLKALSAPEMKGRLIGSPSGAKAESYVVERMTASGLQVKTQDVTLPIWDPGTPVDLSVVDAAGKPIKTLEYITQYREVRFSGSGSVTAQLHFVGYGVDTSYQGIDVAGKVVAILTTPPAAFDSALLDEKIQRAHQKGAIGILFVPSGIDATYDAQIAEQYQPEASHDYGKVDMSLLVPDMPVLWLHVGAEQELLGKTTAELVAASDPFDAAKRVHVEVHGTTYPTATCKNVFGLLPGTDPGLKKEVVYISAHYDHVGPACDGSFFPGAADNASGSATVLEAAFSFAKVTTPPKRTLVFALFCGEDQGIYGSMHYVASPLFPLADTVLDVNVDYVGDTDGPYMMRDKKVALQDQFISAFADRPITMVNVPFQCGSDECPFQMNDIAFLRFITQGPHHHSRTDTYENLTMPNVEKVAHAVVRGIAKIGY